MNKLGADPSAFSAIHGRHIRFLTEAGALSGALDISSQVRALMRDMQEAVTAIEDPYQKQRLGDYINYWNNYLLHRPNDDNDDGLSAPEAPQQTGPYRVGAEPAAGEVPAHLIGRDKLFRTLKQCLLTGQDVALYGDSGAGKTSLAEALLSDPQVKASFPDPPLSARLGRHPQILANLTSWATKAGIAQGEAAAYATRKQRTELVKDKIHLENQRRLLLVDDAFTLEAAEAFRCGGPRCLHVLTTYKAPMAVAFAGKGATFVGGLDSEFAVELFRQNAPRIAATHSADVAELCHLLGRLPLSIRLASRYLEDAAETDAESQRLTALMEAVRRTHAERFDTATDSIGPESPVELRTLLKIIRGALPRPAQHVLSCVSLFATRPYSFPLDILAGACYDTWGLDSSAVREAISVLIRCALLEADRPGRYSAHRSVAETREEEISVPCVRSLVRRYIDYVRSLQHELAALDTENENIYSVIGHAHSHGLYRLVLDSVNAFFPYLEVKGLYEVAEEYLQKAGEAAEALGDTGEQASVYMRQGLIHQKRGQFEAAKLDLQRCLNIVKDPEDADRVSRWSLIHALHIRAIIGCDAGTYVDAARDLQHALVLAGEMGLPELRGMLLNRLTIVETNRGNFAEARSYAEEGIRITGEEDFHVYTAHLLNVAVIDNNEAADLSDQGQDEQATQKLMDAEERLRTALDSARRNGDRERLAGILHEQGEVSRQKQDPQVANHVLAEALKHARETGLCWYESRIRIQIGEILLSQQNTPDAEHAFETALTMAPCQDLTALALFGLARVAEARHQYEEARRCGVTAHSMLTEIGHFRQSRVEAWLKHMNQLVAALG